MNRTIDLTRLISFATKLLILPLLLGLASCSTPDKIAYFQDLEPGGSELAITTAQKIKVRPGDKISIIVNSREPQLSELFNLPVQSRQIGSSGSHSSSNQGLLSYTIDDLGCIDFPVLGPVKVEGKTRSEIAALIKGELIGRNLVKDPVVTVEFVNLGIAVLGEVNDPGRYDIDRDRLTILDAISMAGDLTIYGNRQKVLVLRNEEGMHRVYGVNLCSAEHVYASPVYILQQNDVIYVEPNNVRARQSTVNGNNVRSTSFWFSLTSLLMSICILVFN